MEPSSDLPAPPPPSPPTPTPSLPVLNYLTPTRAMRRASGGLFLLGLGLLLIPVLFSVHAYFNFSRLPGLSLIYCQPWLARTLVFLGIAAASLTYIIAAVMIRRGKTTLAPVALILVILQTLALLGLTASALARAWSRDLTYGLDEALLQTILLALINVGFGSVIVELIRVIRQSRSNALPLNPEPPENP